MRAIHLSLLLAVGWGTLDASGLLEPLERLSAQGRYWLRPSRPFESSVAVLAIDEAALARYGRMPWERRRFAAVLERLADAGAKAVALDIAFNEPASNPREDEALARALKRVPTVLPVFLAHAGASAERLQAIEPVSILARSAAALGSVHLSTRQQGQLWEFEPYQQLADCRLPSLPTALVSLSRDEPWRHEAAPWLWRESPLFINFHGPAGSAPIRSITQLLDAPNPPSDLKGRLVLVGATAAGLPDTNFIVPDLRAGPMAGVEAFAHVVENLLAGSFWRRLSLGAFLALMLALAAFPGRPLLEASTPSRQRVLLWAGASAAWLALASLAFGFGVWLEVAPVLAFFFSAFIGGVFAERSALLRSRNRLLESYASDLASEGQRQRDRLEGELHDGIQQLLIALGRDLRQARKHLDSPEQAEARLSRAEAIAQEAVEEVRRVRKDLLPSRLRSEGLLGAAFALALETGDRCGFRVEVVEEHWEPISHELEVELYWMLKEALNNVEKYAQAGLVTIRLSRSSKEVCVEVVDDGVGFTPGDLSVAPEGLQHTGLHRMWLRMRGRGGDLSLASRPGKGTSLRFSLPVTALVERNRL